MRLMKLTPGSFWDRYWSDVFRQPTLEWSQAHCTVRKDDLVTWLCIRADMDTDEIADAYLRLRDACGMSDLTVHRKSPAARVPACSGDNDDSILTDVARLVSCEHCQRIQVCWA